MGKRRLLPYFIDILILTTINIFLSEMIREDQRFVYGFLAVTYSMVALYSLRTYDSEKCKSWNLLFISVVIAFSFSSILLVITSFIEGNFILARKYIFYFAVLGVVIETLLHRAYPALISNYSENDMKDVILYGKKSNDMQNKIIESLKKRGKVYGLKYKGTIDFLDGKWYFLNGGPQTEISEIKKWLKEKLKEREFVLLHAGNKELLSYLEEEIDVPVISDKFLYEMIERKILLDSLSFTEMYEASFPRWYDNVKSIADEIIGFIGTVLTFPFVLIFALIVLTEDPHASPIYTQIRLGKNGKHYKVYKIRSMKAKAEETTGAVWSKGKEDPRVLRIGKFMRKFRIDEFPQFWNILKGDMSLIGPRPERPEIAEKLRKEVPFYTLRLKVKPGITGWAQINHHYDETIEDVKEKLRYDLYYIKHRSLTLDLNIFLLTVETVIFGRGAK